MRLPLEPLAPQEPVRSAPSWITLLKIYICQYLSCVFLGMCTTSAISHRGSTLHQPAHEQTLHHRHNCTYLTKPGEETYLDIRAGSASVGSQVWHDS